MKRLGSSKWILAAGALMVVVSLGAVACGSASDDASLVPGQRPNAQVQGPGDAQGKQRPGLQASTQDRQEAMQDRREAAAERRADRLEELRDEMTAEDQALLDQLQATIAEQREALEQDRQELADTLKELRELAEKYLDAGAENGEQ